MSLSRRRRRRRHGAATLAGALLALGFASGCTGYSGTQDHQVSQWATQYTVISNDQTVMSDVKAIKLSLRAHKLKDVTSNCAGLVTDAGTGYGNLPTPDNVLTNELGAAYQDLVNAGGQCAQATSLGGAKVTGALRTIATGVAALERATRRLAADGVS